MKLSRWEYRVVGRPEVAAAEADVFPTERSDVGQ